jgi:hypothetical protein
MPLREVLVRSTWTPAQAIGRTDLGHLSVGAVADVTAIRLLEGDFAYRDQENGRVRGKQRLQPELTLRDGKVVWDLNSRSGTDWQQLPKDYGIRPGMDHVVPPPDDRAQRQLLNLPGTGPGPDGGEERLKVAQKAAISQQSKERRSFDGNLSQDLTRQFSEVIPDFRHGQVAFE